jgi:hypothetical protein
MHACVCVCVCVCVSDRDRDRDRHLESLDHSAIDQLFDRHMHSAPVRHFQRNDHPRERIVERNRVRHLEVEPGDCVEFWVSGFGFRVYHRVLYLEVERGDRVCA